MSTTELSNSSQCRPWQTRGPIASNQFYRPNAAPVTARILTVAVSSFQISHACLKRFVTAIVTKAEDIFRVAAILSFYIPKKYCLNKRQTFLHALVLYIMYGPQSHWCDSQARPSAMLILLIIGNLKITEFG
jgi:hypothetical protein